MIKRQAGYKKIAPAKIAKNTVGNVTVEMAFLLPIMLLVLAMIFYFGFFLYWQNQLDNSAHRLVKLLVFERSVNNSFSSTDAQRVLLELQQTYPQYRGDLGVAYTLISDVSRRNQSGVAGVRCHSSALYQDINELGINKPTAVATRNMAGLSICLRLNDNLPLAGLLPENFLSDLQDIQRTSYYPVSDAVFGRLR